MPDLDKFESATQPWLCVFGWPEPVGVNEDTIRAVIFVGEAAKDLDALLVRSDNRFLHLEKIGMSWRLSSGHYVGDGSRRDSLVVRTDAAGRGISPKSGIMRLFSGNNGAACTWQEAVAITLDFANLGRLPSGFAWWQGK